MPTVDAQPIHLQTGEKFGRKRYAFAVKVAREPRYGGPPPNLELDILSCTAEAIGKVYFNPVDWLAYTEERGEKRADLDEFIDVKAITQPDHSLIVGMDDPDHWAYVAIGNWESPRFHICGWMWGWQAKAFRLRNRMTGHFVPLDKLHDPALLIDELRKRQAWRQSLTGQF
jgi:hypothetical protein